MTKYIDTIRINSKNLGEDIDRISLEPLPISCLNCKRHACIALEADGRIQYWDTKTLYEWFRIKTIHPITRTSLNIFQRLYIVHYYQSLKFEETNNINENEIYMKFIKADGNLSGNEIVAARAILSPQNFADHFKDYPPLHDITFYERVQAENFLATAQRGRWVLRRSSLTHSKKNREKIDRNGLEFYVVSAKEPENILHYLILHRPGWGWALISNIDYTDGINPRYLNNEFQYYVCFVDVLIKVMNIGKLHFTNTNKGYLIIPK